ncbi:hypothetical protein MicloDRAFT_00001200 [Microvirga lotononidis]|uniref:Uncharacterized protein n=1 Tax=Microvirga lotononidis TaxID=864069 RepID=I4Z4J0_9HYPH|nr:hypothetical protein MicloDRAFT_00001200 [Microvirga lotononidis]
MLCGFVLLIGEQKVAPHFRSDISVREAEANFIGKPPPDRTIKQLRVVRCTDHDGSVVKGIETLQHRVHDTLQFSKLMTIVTQLCYRIHFVEEQDGTLCGRKVEDGPNILGSIPQEGRNHAIEPDNVQWTLQRGGNVPSQE